LGRCGTDKKSC